MLSRATTWTASRDANLGADFTTPWFYDGQGIMTHADFGVSSIEDLDGAVFCLSPGTTSEQNLEDYFGRRDMSYSTVVIEKSTELYNAFQGGRCDAITNDMSGLASRRTQFSDPDAFTLLPKTISKEPLGAYVPQGDAQWRDIVTWVAFALVNAEELDVTSKNVDEMRDNSKILGFLVCLALMAISVNGLDWTTHGLIKPSSRSATMKKSLIAMSALTLS